MLPFGIRNSHQVTIEEQVRGSELFNNSITFDYMLNDKAAKSKILKGAKRLPLEVQENSSSTTLIFSARS